MGRKRLNDRGEAELEGIVLKAPGLDGTLSVEHSTGAGSLRGSGGARDVLDDAIAAMGMETVATVIVEEPRERQVTGPDTRGAGAVPTDRMELTVPAPPPDHEQVVLSVDEHGIATWRFARPEPEAGAGGARRADRATRTYVLDRVTVPPAGASETRGLIPGLDKVVRVITMPVAEVIGQGARVVARQWDRSKHPPMIRRFNADGTLAELDGSAWKELGAGPTLLFVHGTFSTTTGGFGRLPAATLDELHRRYEGRVIAYDHPTIADDPVSNAREFLEAAGEAAGNGRLELDVVCHSRGGLVSRSIGERPGDLAGVAPNVAVRSVVLVGVPNEGTILAKAEHWNELLDRVTTLISLFPGPGISDTLETVLAVVRTIAVEVVEQLEGLDAMAPGGDFLGRINAAGPAGAGAAAGPAGAAPDGPRYYAVVSDFEPSLPALRAWLSDSVRDWLFDGGRNDMMVLVDSMLGAATKGPFPVATFHSFETAQAVEHSDYFGRPETSKALLEWLSPAAPAAPSQEVPPIPVG